MAIMKPGGVTSSISGTIGSVNFAATKNGATIRRALIRTNQRTPSQLARRARFKQLQLAWRTLTTQQRDSWTSFAANITEPDRLGTPRHLTGFQWFMKHNWFDSAGDGSFREDAPDQQRLNGPFDLALSALVTPEITIKYEVVTSFIGETILYFGQRSMSSSTSFSFNRWRLFFSGLEFSGLKSLNLTTEWLAAFGTPVLGEFIAIQLQSWTPERLASARFTATASVLP